MADSKDILEEELEDYVAEHIAEENREKTEPAAEAESAGTEDPGAGSEACEADADMEPEEACEAKAGEEDTEEEQKAGKKLTRAEKKAAKKAEAAKEAAYVERISALEDQVKRQMAEFDNFRKRTEKEKSSMFEAGAKSVIEKILPVVDNFERGLASVPEEDKGTPFAEGMQLIYKQMMTELEAIGVKPIEAVGQEFNPDFHNAVMQTESDEYESGVVAQELLKGYTYRDSVVRHSMVAVVQ